MQYFGSYSKNGNADIAQLKTELEKIEGKVTVIDNNGKFPLIVTVNGYTFEINDEGDVFSRDEQTGTTAKDIANSTDKSKYYGAIVTNYECNNNAGVNAWKIFYADENNIYLIADDYIASTYVPKGKGGSSLNQGNTEYGLYFTNVLSDYNGSTDITDTKIQALNSNYFNYLTENSITNSKDNMKAVAYMLDTNVWRAFKGEKAQYAIGGPTIEMLMSSYSQKHGVDYRAQTSNSTGLGYEISKDGGATWAYTYSFMMDSSDNLYVISDREKAFAMWVSSPSGDGNPKGMINLYLDGLMNMNPCNTPQIGFRPLVCLNSNIQLEKNSDGTYAIK